MFIQSSSVRSGMVGSRFLERVNRILDNDALRRIAPSIFAESPYHSVSDRYGFISTIQVVEQMREAGFFPVFASEARVRLEDKEGFARHMIRFQREGQGEIEVGGIIPQVCLTNGHEGLTKYNLFSGLYRKICANGLCVPDSLCEGISVRHTKSAAEEIIEGSFEIVKRIDSVLPKIEEYKQIQLTSEEQKVFASSALLLKYEPDSIPVKPEQVLEPRRRDDIANDLFTTFNRIQESLIEGGNRGRDPKTGKSRTTRQVKSISENVKLNKALFELTEQMAKIKKG